MIDNSVLQMFIFTSEKRFIEQIDDILCFALPNIVIAAEDQSSLKFTTICDGMIFEHYVSAIGIQTCVAKGMSPHTMVGDIINSFRISFRMMSEDHRRLT